MSIIIIINNSNHELPCIYVAVFKLLKIPLPLTFIAVIIKINSLNILIAVIIDFIFSYYVLLIMIEYSIEKSTVQNSVKWIYIIMLINEFINYSTSIVLCLLFLYVKLKEKVSF